MQVGYATEEEIKPRVHYQSTVHSQDSKRYEKEPQVTLESQTLDVSKTNSGRRDEKRYSASPKLGGRMSSRAETNATNEADKVHQSHSQVHGCKEYNKSNNSAQKEEEIVPFVEVMKRPSFGRGPDE